MDNINYDEEYIPLISIIMAVYNNERYIHTAAMSVLNQNFRNIELIIVDDGSTDNTPSIADSIAKDDDRVKVIHQENQWIFASFNNGIRAAKGEYIYIVNSDDLVLDNAFSLIARKIKEYKFPDVIWGGIIDYFCDEELNVHKSEIVRSWNSEILYVDIDDNPEMLMELVKANYFRDQANIYKRKLMLETPFRNDFYSADGFFNYEVASKISTCAICKDILYGHHRFDSKYQNTANKRYYGYEQFMYNELFRAAIGMIKNRGINTSDNKSYFEKKRKRQFSGQIRRLLEDCNYKTIEERLDEIFLFPIDEVIQACFEDGGREEYDSRFFSELRRFFVGYDGIEGIKNHFSYKLLESLLRYEKDDNDWENIRNGIYNDKNPNRIGETFYKKLCDSSDE